MFRFFTNIAIVRMTLRAVADLDASGELPGMQALRGEAEAAIRADPKTVADLVRALGDPRAVACTIIMSLALDADVALPGETRRGDLAIAAYLLTEKYCGREVDEAQARAALALTAAANELPVPPPPIPAQPPASTEVPPTPTPRSATSEADSDEDELMKGINLISEGKRLPCFETIETWLLDDACLDHDMLDADLDAEKPPLVLALRQARHVAGDLLDLDEPASSHRALDKQGAALLRIYEAATWTLVGMGELESETAYEDIEDIRCMLGLWD